MLIIIQEYLKKKQTKNNEKDKKSQARDWEEYC